MRNITQIIGGALLVAAGVLFALDLLGYAEVYYFFDGWWALFIIVPCLLGLLFDRYKTENVFGIIVGVALFLCARGILSWMMLIPLLIVILGIRMIIHATTPARRR